METALHARDRVGVQDFVLLEEYRSVTAFVDNLKKRFLESIIYTYIGPVLISVNPYKVVNIYNDKVIATYKNVNIYELPPHIYAVADNAYRSMQLELRNQCMLISGESGAGKTEASKKILQFIASATTANADVDLGKIRDRLLQSNPILEAFGNAKTNRNDNSSRFGKYMDIQFDFQGSPIGGVILSYLLEKSRVVHQAPGERNFHIFYQLVRGAGQNLLTQLDLEELADSYFYLNQGDCEYMGGYTATIEEGASSNLHFTDDESDFEVVKNALDICEFSEEEQMALFSIISFILHLGNIGFLREQGLAVIANKTPIPTMAKLIGCPQEKIQTGLTNRSILVDGERVVSPLNMEQAIYARDAFAKGLYERVFMWIVKKINSSLVADDEMRKSDIGLLDIYGFEIFETNSFEQFCINYCNEKLQQLFLTLTLKQEQEEYLNEGIEWEPVQYFNNKVICDLVEKRQWGIIAIMDDTCLMPGEATDEALLDRMSKELRGHQHFLSHSIAEYPEKKTIGRDEFRLLHYAGEVTYNIDGFLDKNNDLFYRDLKEALSSTTNLITSSCFKQTEIDDKKRPDTAGTQFKNSLNELMDILAAKEPSYIRCIKPNDKKKPNLFDDQIVRHQVKYLGLMENLRVRRAGFAYRREFDQFLNRYKSMTSKTWPHFNGTAREGVEILVDHLEFQPDDYKLGKTKIFIRFPRLLFSIEDALHNRKHILAEVIQTRFRTYRQRKKFIQMRESATKISCTWKMYQAKQTLRRLRNAAQTTRKFMIGFIKRKQPLCEENRLFVGVMRYNFLMNIKSNLPRNLADKSWPESTTPLLREASELLRKLYIKNAVRKYCLSMNAERKARFEEKVVAETLFKGKKESYEKSVKKFFQTNKLDSQRDVTCNNKFTTTTKPPNETIVYSTLVAKYNRNGYSTSLRALIVTDSTIYILSDKDFKLKEKVLFEHLKGISVSSHGDGFFVVHLDSETEQAKGDIILATDCMTEAVVKIVMAAKKVDAVNICDNSIIHQMPNGKQGLIEFTTGPSFSVSKGKNGHLVVACPPGNKPQTSKNDSKVDGASEFSVRI